MSGHSIGLPEAEPTDDGGWTFAWPSSAPISLQLREVCEKAATMVRDHGVAIELRHSDVKDVVVRVAGRLWHCSFGEANQLLEGLDTGLWLRQTTSSDDAMFIGTPSGGDRLLFVTGSKVVDLSVAPLDELERRDRAVIRGLAKLYAREIGEI